MIFSPHRGCLRIRDVGGNATDATLAMIGAARRPENAERNGSTGPERDNALDTMHERAEPDLFEE